MNRYAMKEIPKNGVVVLDVPAGRLRVGGKIARTGEEGVMVFSIADKAATPGDVCVGEKNTPAVKIAVHGPGSAAAISKAFAEMAHDMIDLAVDLDDEDGNNEEEFELPCDGVCVFCEGCGADED